MPGMPPIHRPHATAAHVRRCFGTDPVTVAAVLDAGVTPGQLRAAVAAATLRRVRRGVLVAAEAADLDTTGGRPGAAVRPAGPQHPDARLQHREACAAALLLSTGAVVSHDSAALLLGLPTPRPGRGPDLVHVTADRHGHARHGLRVHEGTVPLEDLALVDRVRCTSAAHTALDVGRCRALPESLVVLDAAARTAGTEALAAAYTRLGGHKCLGSLAWAVNLADPRSESPLESASRGVMIGAGLPVPDLQVWVRDRSGQDHRVDFLWPDRGVVGEADGWGKYAAMEDVRVEKRREDALRDAGFLVVRWTSDELWRKPRLVVERLRRVLGT